jgi:hypothetical protein
VSALKKVESAAKSATSALNSMAAAARKATSAASSVGGFQHGGSFFSAQRGFSGIVNTPTTFRGGRMGEGFAPELVTVTPLTRGTGNHHGPTVSSSLGGGGGGRPIEIHVHNEMNGREFSRFIKKVALEDIGVQI